MVKRLTKCLIWRLRESLFPEMLSSLKNVFLSCSRTLTIILHYHFLDDYIPATVQHCRPVSTEEPHTEPIQKTKFVGLRNHCMASNKLVNSGSQSSKTLSSHWAIFNPRMIILYFLTKLLPILPSQLYMWMIFCSQDLIVKRLECQALP